MSVEARERDIATLSKDFDRLGVQILGALAEEKEERLKIGHATDETGRKMDDFNRRWEQVVGDLSAVKQAVDDMRLDRQRQAMHGGAAYVEPEDALTQFVASEEYKSYCNSNAKRMERPYTVKGGLYKPRHPQSIARAVAPSVGTKAMTSSELEGLVWSFRNQQVITDPLRPRRLLDIIPSLDIGEGVNGMDLPRENVVREIVGFLSAQANSGQADVVLGVETDETQTDRSLARGFIPGATVTIAPGTVSEEEHEIDSISHTTGTITLTANLANTHAKGVRITATSFAFTPEAEIKPQSEVGTEIINHPLKTLATWMAVSKQMARRSSVLQGYLSGRMGEFLELSKEKQILSGDGTQSDQLGGILNDADIGTYLQSSGLPGDTELDALRRSFTVVFLSFFPADAFVVNPLDWEKMETLKANGGLYVFSQIQSGPGPTRVWRSVPVETPVIDQGTILSGSFSLGCMLLNGMMATMSIMDQHKGWAVLNKLLFLIEEDLGFAVIRPAAFVKTTLDDVPS